MQETRRAVELETAGAGSVESRNRQSGCRVITVAVVVICRRRGCCEVFGDEDYKIL
jgi:hypothetical protein